MVNVQASEVKTLRDRTGAGMMDCKKALVESQGDIEVAVDWLRKKGLAAAAKKAGRVAAEGLIGVCVCGNNGALIEVNAETDFVARNELFQKYVGDVVNIACTHEMDIESLNGSPYPASNHSVAEELTNIISIVGENMGLRRLAQLNVSSGVIASYVHNKVAENLGKIGILVAIESSGNREKLLELGKKIAMHIAAASPLSTSIDDLDPAVLEREKAIVSEQAQGMGKPAEFIDKIVEGRIRKFYEESILLEQIFVIDGNSRVKDVIAGLAKEIGAPVVVKGFVKYVLGDGIEKQPVDFAAEVAAQLN
ncbi:MAG: translation elongation factor Ts [Holosporaceae bacterium]|jgi:elongation factor Ts|nr:translation elongation factor Ts [Holosporaceae bacterium]